MLAYANYNYLNANQVVLYIFVKIMYKEYEREIELTYRHKSVVLQKSIKTVTGTILTVNIMYLPE